MMKKEKIYNIIITCISFLLLFLPVYATESSYIFTIRVLFIAHNYLPGFALKESLVFTCSCISIATLILSILKESTKTKILSTVCSLACVLMWIIALFANFTFKNTSRGGIVYELSHGANIFWIVLYFIMLLAIIVFNLLQYIPHSRNNV